MSSTAIRAYDVNLTANGAQQLRVLGTFIKLLSATGTLEVSIDDGGFFPLLPGQGFAFDQPFTYLSVRDTSGSANLGRLLIGSGRLIDDRITGDVNVIDTRKSLTLTQQAFQGVLQPNTGAAQFGIVQLNNVSATRRIIVKRILIIPRALMSVRLGFHALVAGTIVGGLPSKLSGAGSSVTSQMRVDNTAGVIVPTNMLCDFQSSAPFEIVPEEPWVINPGAAPLTIASYTVAVDFLATVQVVEEAV